MATPFFVTGFNHQVISSNGGGLFNAVTGVPTIDNSVLHEGSPSLKIAPTGSQSVNVRKVVPASQEVLVLSGYIRFPSGGFPSANSVLFGCISTTGSIFSGINISNTGVIRAQTGNGGSIQASSITMTPDQWYLVDLLISQAGTTWTVDWSIDGVPQTQLSVGGQTQGSISNLRFGTNTTAISMTAFIANVVASVVSADYPIGPHASELLVPVSDGTHNSGTNIMEDQAGTDLGTAWSLVDDIPMSDATEYIKQAGIGTGNYVEVKFRTMTNPSSSIIAAMGILAYTSASSAANSGGFIISKDGFGSNIPIYGSPGSLADYSSGSVSDVFYSTAMLTDIDTLTEVDALQARMGYSGDATPNPYWINIAVEVVYVPGSSTVIDLDLVSYSIEFNDITIVEQELISLDLVTYSSTEKDINITEHELIHLDLVSYSSIGNDITLLENEPIYLDMVSVSISFNDIDIVEQELILLDPVSFSSSVNDITLVESELIELDLITYSVSVNEISVLEPDDISLDLVVYSTSFNDISLSEDETISLDPVSYSIVYNDMLVVESELIHLDPISYSNTVKNISVLENEPIHLDLISQVSSVNDITLLENEVINLDVVSYSQIIEDITIVDNDNILLDLVEYQYSVTAISFTTSMLVVRTPIERTILILKEDRTFPIKFEKRSIEILFEDRSIQITNKEN